jgi:hypothetical protein
LSREAQWFRANFIEYVGRVPGERTMLYRVRDNPWWEPARRYALTQNSRLKEAIFAG